jgi:hypothetical protein
MQQRGIDHIALIAVPARKEPYLCNCARNAAARQLFQMVK